MSIIKVRNYFKNYNMEDRILEFDSSSKTVALAAQTLGVKEEMIAKTLSFSVNDKTILIVTSGTAKIDNAKYKEKFHTKARMLNINEVEKMVGHEVGGVCPFAVNEDVDVYLDISLKKLSEVYPACGSGNSAIKLSISELEKYSNYKEWIDVCKI